LTCSRARDNILVYIYREASSLGRMLLSFVTEGRKLVEDLSERHERVNGWFLIFSKEVSEKEKKMNI